MIKARKTGILALVVMSLGGLLLTRGQTQKPSSRIETQLSAEERERLLSIGKKLFVERCAKCHDERGDKPLKTGPPLSERNLSDEEITRTVSGRFRDASEEQKRAVTLYILSFIKRK